MLSTNLIRLEGISSEHPARKVITLDHADDTLPFERIICPDLRYIGQNWHDLSRRDGDKLPEWSSFKLAHLVDVADKLCVLRVRDGRIDDIEFSLYGGHPTDFLGHGKPLVMKHLRNDPERAANYIDIRNRAERAVQNQAPQYARKTLSWNKRNFVEYETLMLPFAPSRGVQRLLQPISAWTNIRPVAGRSQFHPCPQPGEMTTGHEWTS